MGIRVLGGRAVFSFANCGDEIKNDAVWVALFDDCRPWSGCTG